MGPSRDRSTWAGESGKEMTGEKTIGGLRIKTQPQWQQWDL